MARESPVRRRTLGRGWLESLAKSKAGSVYALYCPAGRGGDPLGIHLRPELDSMTYERYRECRAAALEVECRLLKHRHPNAKDIIGIASESGLSHIGRSEDLMYFNARSWSDKDERSAAKWQSERDVGTSTIIVPAEYNERRASFSKYLSAVSTKVPATAEVARPTLSAML